MQIEFLLPEYGEQSEQKMNKSPCSSRCWPSGHTAGKRPLRDYIASFLYSRTTGIADHDARLIFHHFLSSLAWIHNPYLTACGPPGPAPPGSGRPKAHYATAVARNLLQDSCLTISCLSPTQNPCLFTLWY